MTTNAATLENLKPEAAKNGIGLGLITLVAGVLSAYLLVGTSSMMTVFIVPIVLGLIVPLVIAIFFCIDLRKKIGGFWNLRQATSGIFIMFLVTYIISNIGNVIFNEFIEKDMASRIQHTVLDATESMMRSQGADDEKVDAQIEKMNNDFEQKQQGSVMKTIQGHVIGIIIVFVAALIFGAVFKREPPLVLIEE